jgi:hypothetical protein
MSTVFVKKKIQLILFWEEKKCFLFSVAMHFSKSPSSNSFQELIAAYLMPPMTPNLSRKAVIPDPGPGSGMNFL